MSATVFIHHQGAIDPSPVVRARAGIQRTGDRAITVQLGDVHMILSPRVAAEMRAALGDALMELPREQQPWPQLAATS